MKLSINTSKFAVYDDILEEKDYKDVWRWVQQQDYNIVNNTGWMKVWRLSDGHPMGGHQFDSTKAPFDTALEPVRLALNKIVEAHPVLFGEWDRIIYRSYIYPKGTRIDWHNDQGYEAAAIFYTHPKWAANWGGELKVAEVAKDYQYSNIGGQVDVEWREDFLNTWGVGHYIVPKPNRFVVTAGGVWHSINRVDEDAGDNCRCSIVCFFRKDEKPPANPAM